MGFNNTVYGPLINAQLITGLNAKPMFYCCCEFTSCYSATHWI